MKAARILSDPSAVRPSKAIAAAVRAVPLVVVTHRALADLADELGGHEQAARWLVDLAQEVDRPMLVNFPTGPDTSSTIAFAPFWWGEERLRGYVGGLHQEIEVTFGPSTIRQWGND